MIHYHGRAARNPLINTRDNQLNVLRAPRIPIFWRTR